MTTTAATTSTPPTPSEVRSCCGPDCCATETAAPPAAVHTEQLVEKVRERYGQIAEGKIQGCCGPSACGSGDDEHAVALSVGYSPEELAALPDGANLGLGCGAPIGALALRPGETVLDLGSGAGVDAFLAARAVGPDGHVIGVDMTPAMLARARENAREQGLAHVEFREGRLEALPVDSASVDAVTSNCVINLVPDKARVFAEIARVLRPGGRLVVSDILLDRALPARLEQDLLAYVGCVAGASLRETYFESLRAAGLGSVEILRDTDYLAAVSTVIPAEIERLLGDAGIAAGDLAGVVRSVTFRATKT